MSDPSPFVVCPLDRLPSNDERHEIPQFYRSPAARVAAAHPLYREIVARCVERWPGVELTVEAQCAVARPGTTPALPVWHRLPASSTGEVMIACLGGEALLEWHPCDRPDASEDNDTCAARLRDAPPGVRAPGDALVFAPAGGTVRFASPTRVESSHITGQMFWIVVLVRPRDGAVIADRPRQCARQFEVDEKRLDGPMPAWAADRSLRFDSKMTLEAPMPSFGLADMLAEPLFAGARYLDARERGGPIMQAFLDRMPAAWQDPAAGVIFFGKLDELSPGWWPALGEWHIDGIGRSVHSREDGTPNWMAPVATTSQRAVGIGPVAPTAFLVGEVRLPMPPLHTPAGERRRVWQSILRDDIAAGRLRVGRVEPDRVFHFAWGDFHGTAPAEQPGWRFFCKATLGRNWTPPVRPFGRSSVVWPVDAARWPADPCGVFPQVLPVWQH